MKFIFVAIAGLSVIVALGTGMLSLLGVALIATLASIDCIINE